MLQRLAVIAVLLVSAANVYGQQGMRVEGLPRHNVSVLITGRSSATIHNGSGQDILALNAVWRPTPAKRPLCVVGMLEIDERQDPAIRSGESLTVEGNCGWNPVSLYIVALFRDGTIAGPDESDPDWSLRAELREKYAAERDIIRRFHELAASGKQEEAIILLEQTPRDEPRGPHYWHSLFAEDLRHMAIRRGIAFADAWASRWIAPPALVEVEP